MSSKEEKQLIKVLGLDVEELKKVRKKMRESWDILDHSYKKKLLLIQNLKEKQYNE